MVDQQEIWDEGWLVGFMESEGYITIAIGRYNKNRRNGESLFQLIPRIGVTNTSKEMIDKAASILKRWNVGHYIKVHHNEKRSRWTITILGQKRCRKLLNIILPKLVGKREQGRILDQFISLREQTDSNKPYTNKEYQLYLDILRANGRTDIPKLLRDYMRSSEKDNKQMNSFLTTASQMMI